MQSATGLGSMGQTMIGGGSKTARVNTSSYNMGG